MHAAARQTTDDRSVRRDDSNPQLFSEKTLKMSAWVAGLMLLAFLVGYVPPWLSAIGYEQERDSLQKAARVSLIRHQLASATLNADDGHYDEARLHASHFFTKLRNELEREDTVFVENEEKEQIQEILGRRDEIITMLAREERGAADVMADWYLKSDRFGKSSDRR